MVKETTINANTTAPNAGNPILTRSGPMIAAGVPKPATASKNAPNNQEIIIT